MTYDSNQIIKFKERVLKEYEKEIEEINTEIRVQTILDTHRDERENGTYMQIALRPLLKKIIFEKQKGKTFYSSEIVGLGSSVGIGERKYLVDKIAEKAKKVKVKEFDLTAVQKNKLIVFCDSSTYYDESMRGVRDRIRYVGNESKLGNITIIITNSESLRNGLLIVEPDTVNISKITTVDKDLEREIPLHFDFGKLKDDVEIDVLVRSIIKAEINNPEKNVFMTLERLLPGSNR